MGMKFRVMLVFVVLLAVSSLAFGATHSGELTVPWWTFSAGQSEVSGSEFSLVGMAGQTAVGSSSGNMYILEGGFLQPDLPHVVYLPVITYSLSVE